MQPARRQPNQISRDSSLAPNRWTSHVVERRKYPSRRRSESLLTWPRSCGACRINDDISVWADCRKRLIPSLQGCANGPYFHPLAEVVYLDLLVRFEVAFDVSYGCWFFGSPLHSA